MGAWILGILFAAIVVVAVIAIGTSGPAARARRERRKRYRLDETADRIDFIDARPAEPVPMVAEIPPVSAPAASPVNPAASVVETQDSRPPRKPLGRLVVTPDGESILTTPPFELRDAVFTRRAGKYVTSLYRRLPPWVVVCPKVRLDALLTPTAPDGRDASDWRVWRQRVRVRAVDLLLCDRRTWRPLLAVIIDGTPSADAQSTQITRLAGGKDRIIDEVLGAVGLPFIRGTGRFADDWPTIRPYIENAILPAPPEQQVIDEARRARPNGAVSLLRMDDSKGWLLE